MVVFETVYNPEQTLLVKLARESGCEIVMGIDMCIRRAALQYEKFNDKQEPLELKPAELKQVIGAARH